MSQATSEPSTNNLSIEEQLAIISVVLMKFIQKRI